MNREKQAYVDQHFDTKLAEVIKENAGTLLSIEGVYEVLSEHFNNEVIEELELQFDLENPEQDETGGDS
jgi:hypothetical protein